MRADLDALVDELRAAAGRLRTDELAPDEAAALVERCAELAASVGAALEERSREAAEVEGQERLL